MVENFFRRVYHRVWPEKKQEPESWTDVVKNPALAADWFIMFYFRVLPTDDRYRAMSVIQKEYLFRMYMDSPTVENFKEAVDSVTKKRQYPDLDDSGKNLIKDWFGDKSDEFLKEFDQVALKSG